MKFDEFSMQYECDTYLTLIVFGIISYIFDRSRLINLKKQKEQNSQKWIIFSASLDILEVETLTNLGQNAYFHFNEM